MAANKEIDQEIAHLVSMGNDIAVNLSFHENATDRIAEHIKRFWAPRMRTILCEYAASGAEDVSDKLRLALDKLQD